jgi:hypothetical protein
MKSALLLSGNVRTFERCKENFKNTFGDIDIFISTYNLKYGYHPIIKSSIGDSNDELLSPDYMSNLFSGLNVKSVLIENIDEATALIDGENSKLHPSMQNIHSSYGQCRKLKQATDLVIDYEMRMGFKYDNLIRARFDLVYDNFDFEIGEKELIHNAGGTPEHELLGDHFFWTNRDDMINIANFIMQEFYNPIYPNSHESPPHGVLRNAIKHNNLKRTPKHIVRHLLRKNGQKLIL